MRGWGGGRGCYNVTGGKKRSANRFYSRRTPKRIRGTRLIGSLGHRYKVFWEIDHARLSGLGFPPTKPDDGFRSTNRVRLPAFMHRANLSRRSRDIGPSMASRRGVKSSSVCVIVARRLCARATTSRRTTSFTIAESRQLRSRGEGNGKSPREQLKESFPRIEAVRPKHNLTKMFRTEKLMTKDKRSIKGKFSSS